MTDVILTRDDGTPIEKPRRADYANDVDYARAFHKYKDEVTKIANDAFDAAWRERKRA